MVGVWEYRYSPILFQMYPRFILSVAMIAVKDVNNSPDVLPNHQLSLDINDGQLHRYRHRHHSYHPSAQPQND